MDLITHVSWVPVIVGAVAAYMLGALWYSEKCFGKKWKEGIGTPAVPAMPMFPGMFTQALGTFLFAWVIGVTEKLESLHFAFLITIMLMVLVAANDFFAGKNRFAIMVETSFILAMAILMVLAHVVF